MASYNLHAPLLISPHKMITHLTPPHRVRVRVSASTGTHRLKCKARADTQGTGPARSEAENVMLKLTWYASELLGIAATSLRPVRSTTDPCRVSKELAGDGCGSVVDRAVVVDAVVQDCQRAYFVTGNMTLEAYEEECEFVDPINSFKGVHRFRRNCINFGYLVLKTNLVFTKWEDFEDKGILHWRFGFILSLPWKPVLSGTAYTEYYYDAESGKICRHVEYRSVPIMTLFKQILTPSGYNDREEVKGEGKVAAVVASEIIAAKVVTNATNSSGLLAYKKAE